MFKLITTTIFNSFGGVWGYVAIAALAAGLSGYSAQHLRYNADQVKYEALQIKDAKAVTASLEAQAAALSAVGQQQHLLDTEVAQGAVAEAKAQDALNVRTITITKEITTYVHDASPPSGPDSPPISIGCISYGLVRVLDAAALSANLQPVTAGDLALPAGQSDDACSPVEPTALAQSVVNNYGTAGKNAEQLNALETKIIEIIDTANKDGPK